MTTPYDPVAYLTTAGAIAEYLDTALKNADARYLMEAAKVAVKALEKLAAPVPYDGWEPVERMGMVA